MRHGDAVLHYADPLRLRSGRLLLASFLFDIARTPIRASALSNTTILLATRDFFNASDAVNARWGT
jgi:hypothetical protein